MCTVAHKDGLALVSVQKLTLLLSCKFSEHYANMMHVMVLKVRT